MSCVVLAVWFVLRERTRLEHLGVTHAAIREPDQHLARLWLRHLQGCETQWLPELVEHGGLGRLRHSGPDTEREAL